MRERQKVWGRDRENKRERESEIEREIMREKERKRDRGRERVRERVREKGGICERVKRRLHEVEYHFHQIIKTMKINFILREN